MQNKIICSVIFAFLLLSLSSCAVSTSELPSTGGANTAASASAAMPAPDLTPPSSAGSVLPSGDGLIRVTLPVNLLGGKDAATYADEAMSESAFFTDVTANFDGTVTCVFTPLQYLAYKGRIYTLGHMENLDPTTIISTVYNDDRMTDITVFVNKDSYGSWGAAYTLDRYATTLMLAVTAGTFQILCGVPPDEWHVTITIKDAATGEIIGTAVYPNPNMYKGYPFTS